MLTVDPNPLLEVAAFATTFPGPLGELAASAEVQALLSLTAPAPMTADDGVRTAVRDLLRQGGYKPTGRGKPASEYLVRAAGEAPLRSINAAVDACNAVSLHSGLPISLVDLDRARAPFRVQVAGPEQKYVFNASGQEIELEGLLCLFDHAGPCANAVKDSQRTKTHEGSTWAMSLIWGARSLDGRTAQASRWYQELLRSMGCQVQVLEL